MQAEAENKKEAGEQREYDKATDLGTALAVKAREAIWRSALFTVEWIGMGRGHGVA